MTATERRGALDAIREHVGADAVIEDPAAIGKYLKDNSWLSPILTEALGQRRGGGEGGGGAPGLVADAVVVPADAEALRAVTSLAARYRLPMTLRGGGTTNFGQSIPLEGGIVLDVRKVNRIVEIADASATAEGGALQGDVDAAARARGLEMTILPTTYASATLAGWVAGGHLGLGGTTYGTTWDGNVTRVKLLTVEEEPREVVLEGSEVDLVLRTAGTTGVILEVTVPLVPARRWLEAVVTFDTFDAAARYVTDLAERADLVQRSAAAQEAPLGPAFTPIEHLYRDDRAVVPLIVDAAREADARALAAGRGGSFHPWQVTGEGSRFPLGYLSYGHRMLWVKKIAPRAAFLNAYFDPDGVWEQYRRLKARFGDDVWLEHKYNRSPWLRRWRGLPEGDGLLPSCLLTLVPGDKPFVEAVMASCDELGVGYQNPHTYSVAESGLFPNIDRILAFAREVDPHGLLNPGKLTGTFFGPGASGAATTGGTPK